MYPAGQQPGTAGDDSDEDAIEALGAVLKAAGITATAGEADSSAGTAASPQPGKKTVVPGASGEPPDASTGPTATRAEDLKQVEPAVEHPGNATYSE